MPRRLAVAALALLLLGSLLVSCTGDAAPIRVEGASATAAATSASGAAGRAPGGATSTASVGPTATATPQPFAATCGIGGQVAAKYDPQGRLKSPAAPSPPAAAASVASRQDPDLERVIRLSLGDSADQFGVAVVDLNGGRYAGLNPARSFYAASLFKLTVLYEVFRQRELGSLSFNESLLYTPYYQRFDLGVAPMRVCSEVAVSRAVDAMITISENVSAVLLQDRTGVNAINRDMVALGLTGTALEAGGVRTTARDMALLLEMIARGRAVSSQASSEMLSLLLRQTVRHRIPAGVPAGIPVANKTGDWEGATHDVAIVLAPSGPYVIAVLSQQSSAAPITALSRAVYRYLALGELPPSATPSPTATATATRTPSPSPTGASARTP